MAWCLDTCSPPAAALAGLWGQQAAQELPARARSFYAALLGRLAQPPSPAPPLQRPDAAAPLLWPSPRAAAVVACSSSARTAVSLPTSGAASAQPPSAGPGAALSAAAPEERSGGNGGRGAVRANGQRAADGAGSAAAPGTGGPPVASNGRAPHRGPQLPPAAGAVLLGELGPAAQAVVADAWGGLSGGETLGGGGVKGGLLGDEPALHVNGGAGEAAEPGSAGGAASESLLTRPRRGGPASRARGVAAGADPGGPGEAEPPSDPLEGLLAAAQREPPLPPPVRPLPPSERGELAYGAKPPAEAEAVDAPSLDAAAPAPAAAAPRASYLGSRTRSYVPMRLVAVGRVPLYDGATGERLARSGVALPAVGPLLLSNDARVFAGSDALLPEFRSSAGDKLAVRLEYIVDRSFAAGDVALQLFNVSRVGRRCSLSAQMLVNGQPVSVGDPGVVLQPGDELAFGRSAAVVFRVEPLTGPPAAVDEALGRLGRPRGPARAQPQQQAQQEQQAATEQPSPVEATGPEVAGTEAAAAGAEAGPSGRAPVSGAELAALAALSRRDPPRAEAALRRQLLESPSEAPLWFLWAQLRARAAAAARGAQAGAAAARARLLFRAAEEAARRMERLPPMPRALAAASRRASAALSAWRRRRPLSETASGSDTEDEAPSEPDLPWGDAGPGEAAAGAQADGSGSAAAAAAPPPPGPRHNWLRVQVLAAWGRLEWQLRMYGSARHLLRAAADEAERHPAGMAAGGGGPVLGYWAAAELEAGNIRNARIVLAEALRKCPPDVGTQVRVCFGALYVFVGSWHGCGACATRLQPRPHTRPGRGRWSASPLLREHGARAAAATPRHATP